MDRWILVSVPHPTKSVALSKVALVFSSVKWSKMASKLNDPKKQPDLILSSLSNLKCMDIV